MFLSISMASPHSNFFKPEFTNSVTLSHPFQVQFTQSSLEEEDRYYDGVSVLYNNIVLRALAQELIEGAWSAALPDAGGIRY